jgi:hypothetical protein
LKSPTACASDILHFVFVMRHNEFKFCWDLAENLTV